MLKKILFILLSSLVSSPLLAAEFVVTSTSDLADGFTHCPATVAQICTLRKAISTANAAGGFNTIVLGSGNYLLQLESDSNNTNENENASGDLDIKSSITIRGAGSGLTTISMVDPIAPAGEIRGENNRDRVLDIISGVVSISNLSIQGGFLSRDTLEGGAGIYIRAGARLVLQNAVVTSNSAPGLCGGGILNRGRLDATNVMIDSNSTSSSYSRIVEFSASALQGNPSFSYPSNGGGLCSQGDSTIANLNNVTISNNNSMRYGGGIFNNQNANLTASNLTLSGNSVVRGQFKNQVDVGRDSFYDLGQGGALYNANGASARILNATIAYNQAQVSGAGITNGSPNTEGRSNTVAGGSISIQNSIISSNSVLTFSPLGSSYYEQKNCWGTIVSLGNNLTDGGCSANLDVAKGDLPQALSHLAPLALNGASIKTHALADGSAAFDAVTYSSENTFPCPASDSRGISRPQGRRCDMGAYEAGTTPAQIDYSPANMQIFGTVRVGSSEPQSISRSVTLTNSGGAAIHIESVSTNDPTHFIIANSDCNNRWLGARELCTINIDFRPASGENTTLNTNLNVNLTNPSPRTYNLFGARLNVTASPGTSNGSSKNSSTPVTNNVSNSKINVEIATSPSEEAPVEDRPAVAASKPTASLEDLTESPSDSAREEDQTADHSPKSSSSDEIASTPNPSKDIAPAIEERVTPELVREVAQITTNTNLLDFGGVQLLADSNLQCLVLSNTGNVTIRFEDQIGNLTNRGNVRHFLSSTSCNTAGIPVDCRTLRNRDFLPNTQCHLPFIYRPMLATTDHSTYTINSNPAVNNSITLTGHGIEIESAPKEENRIIEVSSSDNSSSNNNSSTPTLESAEIDNSQRTTTELSPASSTPGNTETPEENTQADVSPNGGSGGGCSLTGSSQSQNGTIILGLFNILLLINWRFFKEKIKR